MSEDRIKLLYIASTGRAGSTILEMMLNAHSQVWTLGEFHILPWEIKTNRKPCGCGTAIEMCPFWGPIIQQNRSKILDSSLTRFRRSHNADYALRLGELPFVSGRATSDARRLQEIQRYALDNDEILRAVREQASRVRSRPIEWMVDSSKSPYRLMWLAASGAFDLKVIHLTKDPRAFVYSMTKPDRGSRRLYRAARFSLRWQVQNRQFESVIRHFVSPEQALHLRYEELAAQPEPAMEKICQWLKVPFEPGTAERFREGNHGVAGNPSRADSKPIQLDDKWRTALPRAFARICFLVNGGLARKYGYTN